MDLFPIRNDCDHRRALDRFSSLADPEPEPGSAQEATLEALAILIDAYERKKYVMDPPDPLETLRFEMERRGLSVSDLVPFIGQPNRVYEVLSGKRGLSIQMIRRLHRGLGIPLEALIAEPKRA
ncbi:MAG: helix-turn-helix domain-containing protein [Litorivicinaceae bacterium]